MEGSQGKAASVKFVSATSKNKKSYLVIGGILFAILAVLIGYLVISSRQTLKSEADFTSSSCEAEGGVAWGGSTCPDGTTQIGTIPSSSEPIGGSIGGNLFNNETKTTGGTGADTGTSGSTQLCCKAVTGTIGSDNPVTSVPSDPVISLSTSQPVVSGPVTDPGGPSNPPDVPTSGNACAEQTINVRISCPQCSQ